MKHDDPIQVEVLPRRWRDRIELAAKGCWVWQGSQNRNGYGRVVVDGQRVMIHREVYERLVGEIPEGFHADHLCRNRACCNPDHIELVTSQENTLRGVGPTAQNARRTHCVNGHAFDEANTYIRKGKRQGRECLACKRARCQRKEAS